MRSELYVLLVCGGRNYDNTPYAFNVLDTYHTLFGDIMIVQGAAKGADTIGEMWAKSRQQIYVGMPAQWDRYGKRAGMKRNTEMLSLIKPNRVIAFAGGRGTLNIISQSRAAGIDVDEWGWE